MTHVGRKTVATVSADGDTKPKGTSMVDLTLTEEQHSMRAMAHDFAAKEIRPVAWELDLMNAQIPVAYGGPGATYLEGCLIEEELAWGCAGIGTTLGANGLASGP